MKNYNIKLTGISHEVFDDEVVALNLVDGKYYSMAEVGSYIWQSVFSKVPTVIIVEKLSLINTNPDINIAAEIDIFLNSLLSEGLVEVAPEHDFVGTYIEVSLPQQYNTPVLEIYTDMKEVIALDPVHDVSAKGWPNKKK